MGAASHREQQDADCADREGQRGRKGQCIGPVVPRHGARVELPTGHRIDLHQALLRLDVTFVKRDRQLVAVQQDAHRITAAGVAHDNACVSLNPGDCRRSRRKYRR